MYSTLEEQHEKQKLNEGSFSLENRLMEYLRNEYNPDTINSMYDTVLNDLAYKAQRIDLNSGKQEDMNKDYKKIAEDVISRYLQNRNKPAYKRADNLGKRYNVNESFDTVKNTLTQIKY